MPYQTVTSKASAFLLGQVVAERLACILVHLLVTINELKAFAKPINSSSGSVLESIYTLFEHPSIHLCDLLFLNTKVAQTSFWLRLPAHTFATGVHLRYKYDGLASQGHSEIPDKTFPFMAMASLSQHGVKVISYHHPRRQLRSFPLERNYSPKSRVTALM